MVLKVPPSPIPAPLPPWARALLQALPFITAGLQEVLQFIGSLDTAEATQPDEWRHVQIGFELVSNTDSADRYVTTMDIVNITNGQVDSSWTAGDYDYVDGIIGGLVTGYMAYTNNNLRHIDRKYYRRLFNPLTDSKPFPPVGPPEHTVLGGTIGTMTQPYPAPQVSATSTDRTTYPKHWGRNYWPLPGPSNFTSTGHLSPTFVDALGALVHDAYNSLMVGEMFPVTPVTQIQGAPARALLTTTAVQVDDVPDVVRRRRPKHPTHKYFQPT